MGRIIKKIQLPSARTVFFYPELPDGLLRQIQSETTAFCNGFSLHDQKHNAGASPEEMPLLVLWSCFYAAVFATSLEASL